MPTLHELLDALASDGEVAGFDDVFARAVAAVDAVGETPVAELRARRGRRRGAWMAVVATGVAAAIAIPVIVSQRGDHSRGAPHVAVTTSPSAASAVYPHVASISATELAKWTWSVEPTQGVASNGAILWDGREVLVLGTVSANQSVTRSAVGYDPATRVWHPLPDPPVGVVTAVWTGREVLGWSIAPSGAFGLGASYDPTAQRWRTIPAPTNLCPFTSTTAPDSPQPVWTGSRAVLVGHDGTHGCSPTAPLVATAFDLANDRWSNVPSPLRPASTDSDPTVVRLTARLDTLGAAVRRAANAEAACARADTTCRVHTRSIYVNVHAAWVDTQRALSSAKAHAKTAPVPQRIFAITLAFASGRVVANVVWTSTHTTTAGGITTTNSSTGTRLETWESGTRTWTVLSEHIRFGPVLTVTGLVAVPPGSPCPPGSYCVESVTAAGQLVDFSSHVETIARPGGSQFARVNGSVSSGGALVVDTSDPSMDCLPTGCDEQVAAWNPESGRWSALRRPAAVSLAHAQLVWTGRSLVAVTTRHDPSNGGGGVQLAVLHPAR